MDKITATHMGDVMRGEKEVSATAINQFMEVLQDCDFARYAPSTTVEMEQEYEKAKGIIIELDKQF